MALSGALKGLGLAEALTTVAERRRTGVMEVTGPVGPAHLHILDGTLVRAELGSESTEQALAALLTRTEAASPISISEALGQHASTGRDLGELLVEAEALSPKALQTHLLRLTLDRFLQTFEWSQGKFVLHEDAARVRRLGLEPLELETVVADGVHVAEEWPVISGRVLEADHCYDRQRAVGTDEAGLGPNEMLLYTLVREDRSLQQLEDLSRLGRFETRRALYQLLVLGLVARATMAGPRPKADDGAALRATRRVRLVHAVINLVLVALIFLLAVAVARRQLGAPQETVQGALGAGEGDLRSRLASNQAVRLRTALEVFWMHNGTYPEQLGELVGAQLVRPSDLRFPLYEEEYFYARSGERSYELLPPLR